MDVSLRETRIWSIAGAGLLLVTLITSIHRAWNLSIVHDEARTFMMFCAGPVENLLKFDVNNHVLQSWLTKLSVTLFGISEFTIRLPLLLAHASYCISVFVLARKAFGDSLRLFLILALVGTNPLVLDFFCIARGYGLALSFFFCGLWFLFDAFQAEPGNPLPYRQRYLILTSLCLGLAVSASLAYSFIVLAVTLAVVTLFAVELWQKRSQGRVALSSVRFLATFLLPGTLVAIAILLPYISRIERGRFFAGYNDLSSSVLEVLNSSFFRDEASISSYTSLLKNMNPLDLTREAFLGLPVALGCLLIVIWIAVLSVRTNWGLVQTGFRSAKDRMIFVTCLCGWIACVFYLLSHYGLGLHYPEDRMFVFLFPLLVLIHALLFEKNTGNGFGYVSLVLAIGVILLMLRASDARYIRTWRYDAGSKAIFSVVLNAQQVRASSARPISIGGHWIYEPAMNFYRFLNPEQAVLPYRRVNNPRPEDYDFFVFHPQDFPHLDLGTRNIVYKDPVSGTYLWRR
jgi:4-amino-4-deoxy-L-arabinose transferase-like glycosyltransferase